MNEMPAACLAATTWLEWIIQPSSWVVILQVAFGLGFVIFVHELGHFLVAKACGVKCEKFYIGFDVGGLKLAKFQWGETEYGIGILPLGGYVKMLGQDDNPAAAGKEAARARASGDLPAEPVAGGGRLDPRSYPAQSVGERMAIISAGVIMNVIFAVLMASLAYRIGIDELTCEVSTVRPGGAAWRAGLRTGDEIVAIGGVTDPIFSDLQRGVTLGSSDEGVEFTIHRPADDSTWTAQLKPDTDLGIPTIGVTSPLSTRLPETLARDEAEEGELPAMLRAEPPFEGNERIVAVDGRPVASYAELIAALTGREAEPVRLLVERPRDDAGGQAAEPAANRSATTEILLPPQRSRWLGMAMTAGPIRAVQANSPAQKAGLEAGERILAIDGAPVADPLTLEERLQERTGKAVRLEVAAADGTPRQVEIVPRRVTWLEPPRWPDTPVSLASLGLAIEVEAVVSQVDPTGPAAAAGIAAGERVVRAGFIVNGEQPREGLEITPEAANWPYVESLLQVVKPGAVLRLSVESVDGATRVVDLDPVAASDRYLVDRGLVFEPVYRRVRADSLAAAVARGFRRTLEELGGVYRFLEKITSNEISPRLLGGPIAIAQQAGRSAEEGFGRFLLFLTLLSANLAVVNFLPIPVLDGGHMVFLLYELVTGKPPSERVVVGLSYLGLILLLSLMAFVFGLDLGLIPRR